MPLRRRVSPPECPVEKRQGYIDPREHDHPPFSPGHPFSKHEPGCVCCSPGCLYCEKHKHKKQPHTVQLATTTSLQVLGRVRSSSVPSPRWADNTNRTLAEVISPRSNSFPSNYIQSPRLVIEPPISWPFLRDESESDDIGEETESANSNSVLGPLGALIAELHSRPPTATVRTPFPFAMPHEEFTREDMRHVWAHWIMIRKQKREERQGRVHVGIGRMVEGQQSSHARTRKCADVHGWI